MGKYKNNKKETWPRVRRYYIQYDLDRFKLDFVDKFLATPFN
ncbi:hypothetical protein [Clostridium sp. CTA-7]